MASISPSQVSYPSSQPPLPRSLPWLGHPSSEEAGDRGPMTIGEHQSEPKWRSYNAPEHRSGKRAN